MKECSFLSAFFLGLSGTLGTQASYAQETLFFAATFASLLRMPGNSAVWYCLNPNGRLNLSTVTLPPFCANFTEDKLNNINSDQFFLNLSLFRMSGYPFIKVDNKEILQRFGRDGKTSHGRMSLMPMAIMCWPMKECHHAKAASERKRMDSDLLKWMNRWILSTVLCNINFCPLPGRKRRSGKKWYSAGDEQTVFMIRIPRLYLK